MAKEIIWTGPAEADLRDIYEFNALIQGEEKSFKLVERIILKVDVLYAKITSGTRYISDKHPEINYEKLVIGHHIIIYRIDDQIIYINRVFDTRQNPEKLDMLM